MSNNWQFFRRQKGGGLDGRKALSEYYAMAETYRHTHFAEGMIERDRRASGAIPDAALDRHVVFATLVHLRADRLRAAGEMAQAAFAKLRQDTQALWCCCFMDVDLCDDMADLLELELGWMARAEFVTILADVRDALGPDHFQPLAGAEKDPHKAAHSRLMSRWHTEAVVTSFQTGAFSEEDARKGWMAGLDADCLHEFVLNFDWDVEDIAMLHAVIDHPACDKATAMTLYARTGPEHYDPLIEDGDGFEGALFALVDKIHRRVEQFGFGPSRFLPGEEMTLWHAYRDKSLLAGRPMRWVFSDHAFGGFGSELHVPRYVFNGATRSFLTPFQTWSKITLVTAD